MEENRAEAAIWRKKGVYGVGGEGGMEANQSSGVREELDTLPRVLAAAIRCKAARIRPGGEGGGGRGEEEKEEEEGDEAATAAPCHPQRCPQLQS